MLGVALFLSASTLIESYEAGEGTKNAVSTAPISKLNAWLAQGGGGILSLVVTALGLVISSVAWAITDETFTFPSKWTEQGGEANGGACKDQEIDDYASLKYCFLSTGILAGFAISHGVREQGLWGLRGIGPPYVHTCFENYLGS
eukprot:CAMPEP_0185750508 /NCGR_PEP_ID=MMETSP1174-20130828/9292_1 /TAXON_ID=35687 /ORGANISM="Dictyocha speculum, Strain CCMP1381" /LENGTH=144 /DNA_ID=CAMNT_0028427109 /DNA_START=369 /DNA_END=803 /DNA_ORIENTATION=-